ncbi:MAG: Lrp/AsnC family transcriptional regulator [Opitutales bacterium]|nr:Lrp/AsnC family transcriptional regulator [Opitutales bacterium]
MKKILQLLLEGEALDTEQIGKILSMDKAEVEKNLKKLEEEKILLGWRPVFNPDFESESIVRAAIELKISPERDGGFDRLAERISKFEQVDSCYLMSGAFDLLLFIKARSLKEVASFVYERLASIHGVTSTATHFFLRTYKQQGFLLSAEDQNEDRPLVSP